MKKLPLLILEFIGPFIFIGIAVVTGGLAVGVACAFYDWGIAAIQPENYYLHFAAKGILFGLCFYVYGFSVMVIAPFMSFVLGGRLRPYRGPAVSLSVLRWYLHNALVFLVRYSFLEFVTPTIYIQ